jgi:hypothetical protein
MIRKLTAFLILLAAFGLSIAAATPAKACVCTQGSSPQGRLVGASAVFSGRVTRVVLKQVRDSDGTVVTAPVATLDVKDVWKGPSHTQLEVTAGDFYANCGPSFHEGEEWLIYASNYTRTLDGTNDDYDVLYIGPCSMSTDLASAEADVKALGKPLFSNPATVPSKELPTAAVPIAISIFTLAVVIGSTILIHRSKQQLR